MIGVAGLTRLHSTDMSLITADVVYHNDSNLKQLAGVNMDALIADNGMWQRDERFKDHEMWRPRATCPLYGKSGKQ